MFDIQIKTAPAKKWEFSSDAARSFKVAAAKAMKFLYRRIVVQNKDSYMRPLPPLVDHGWFFFSIKDPRFKKIAKQNATGVNYARGGYPGKKQDLTGSDKRDGKLSGDMWRSLTATIIRQNRKKGGGMSLRLTFARSSITYQGYKFNAKTGHYEFEKRRVRNRTKAFWLQVPKHGGPVRRKNARPVFELMRFSDASPRVIP